MADLLGVAPTHDIAATSPSDAVVSRRALVANTIRYRRRKGTASVLESLAADVSGWRTAAVDQFERLVTTQHLAHPRIALPNTVDIRAGTNLELTPGPFAEHAHTVDIRAMPPRNRESGARPNVANVSLHAYPVDGLVIPNAACLAASAPRLAPAGIASTRSAATSRSSTRRSTIVASTCAPSPTRCRCCSAGDGFARSSTATIGDRRQWWPGSASALADPPTVRSGDRPERQRRPGVVDPIDVDVCCLDPWKPPAPTGRIRVDPVNGRVVVPDPSPPASSCQRRPESSPVSAPVRRHVRPAPPQSPPSTSRGNAASPRDRPGRRVDRRLAGGGDHGVERSSCRHRGVIVLMESARHEINLTGANRIRIPEGSQLTIVGADWPLLPVVGGAPGQSARRLGVIDAERVRPCLVGDIEVDGRAPLASTQPGRLTIDGVLIAGNVTVVGGVEQLGELELRNCTQVPVSSRPPARRHD